MALPACDGTLFKYGPHAAHVAFAPAPPTAAPARARVIIAVGGLTDGFFATPYLPALTRAAARAGWGLITPLLRSSHTGWGFGSLDEDAEDLELLADYLGTARGATEIALVGHSTGCQDAVRYAARQREQQQQHQGGGGATTTTRPTLTAVVLQAPVSDKDWLAGEASTAGRLEAARAAVAAGRPNEIIGRSEWDGAPLSAGRWLSLAGDRGDDDMFSADLTGEDLETRLVRPLAAVPRVLVLASAREQYVPPGTDVTAAAQRLAGAIGAKARAVVLDGDHSLVGAEEEAGRVIADFVAGKEGGVRQD